LQFFPAHKDSPLLVQQDFKILYRAITIYFN